MRHLVLFSLFLLSQDAWGFKLRPLGSSRDRPTPEPIPEKEPKVLVVGATGRVGRHVVSNLLERGYRVICLARDARNSAARELRKLEGAEVMEGNLLDMASLDIAIQGCFACISCSGSNRVSKLSDLWTRKQRQQATHPYYVNYLGTQNLIDAAKRNQVSRIVRVSGASVGYGPLHPVAVLLNTLASMAIAWQLKTEMALRTSGLDYTVIRAGALDDAEPRPQDLVLAADGEPVPVGRVSRQDVAALCVAALEVPQAYNSTLSCIRSSSKKTTADKTNIGELVTKGVDRLLPYKALLRKVARPDVTPLKKKPHALGVSLLGLVLASVVWAVGTAAFLSIGYRWLPTTRVSVQFP